MLRLELLNTALRGKRFQFKDGLTLGSGADAVIRAQHPELLPLHLRLYMDGAKAMAEVAVKDARLIVNGKDVLRAELKHFDELVVGPLRLRVLDESRTSQGQLRLDSLLADYEQKQMEDVLDFAKEDLFYLVTKDPTLKRAISFVIPSKDRFIDNAQAFLARLVRGSGADEEKIDAFMTCAKELVLNAHRHGHKYDETRKIVLRYRDDGRKLRLTVEDQGEGFDHRSILDAAQSKDAAAAARERYQAGGFGGLGFKLITKMADDLKYNDKGNIVTFSVLKKSL